MSAQGPQSAYTPHQRFEAAQWFLDIHETEAPSPEMLQRWMLWMEAAEGNRRAFEAVERTWHDVPADIDAGLASMRAAERPYEGEVAVTDWLQKSASRSRKLPYTVLIAASVVLAFVAGWGLYRTTAGARYSTGQFATSTGEHMEVKLADGSRVSLGARTRLSVDFTRTDRRLRLDSGEAFFEVSKDPRRPFRVQALHGVITAVGTAFNVRATDDRITVAVTEGTVDVRESTAVPSTDGAVSTPSHERRLRSGEQLTFSAQRALPPVEKAALSHVDAEQAVSWRNGWLVYRDEPLRYVIADVARYTSRHVALSGAVNPQLRFTGAVYRGSVVEWLEALPDVFPVSVHADDQEVIVTLP